MRKNNVLRLSLIILVCLALLQGCSPIGVYPEGMWTCDELEIKLDFDDHSPSGGSDNQYTARGEIMVDGELQKVECLIYYEGTMMIGYYGIHKDQNLILYKGRVCNYSPDRKNTFTFRLDSGEKYIFAKQE